MDKKEFKLKVKEYKGGLKKNAFEIGVYLHNLKKYKKAIKYFEEYITLIDAYKIFDAKRYIADYYYYDKKKLWELRSNVQIQSQRGDKFETELLFWDENKEKVYSDKYIRISQEDKVITGYGFESDQNLTEDQIKNTTGIFTVQDKAASPSNGQQTDSLKTEK